MEVVLVVPTYNERENLPILLERISAQLPDAGVLIVDDNSPDGTGAVADEWTERKPGQVRALHRNGKEGLGAAYVAGFRYALDAWPEAQFFIQMDADLSHDPEYLLPMLEAVQEADVVIGSRYFEGGRVMNWPIHRLLISRMGTLYARLLTGLPCTDCTGGYKCFRREVLESLDLNGIESNGYCFQIETNYRVWQLGYRMRDIPITFRERENGRSKMSFGIALEAVGVVTYIGLERLLRRRNVSTKSQHS
ncbi:MAG: putative polyprenol phosphate mannosyl transferase 1 [Candidatus Hydrogenedentota bacterium]